MKNALLILAVSGSLSACATGGAGWGWAAPEVLQQEVPKANSGAEAIYLLRERRITVGLRKGDGYTVSAHHDVVKVLSEKGYSYADVRVGYSTKSEIVGFEARTIGPDGSVQLVQPANVFDDESSAVDKKGSYKVRVFAFPGVKVGSVLEYRYSVEYPFVLPYFSDYLPAKIPTQQFTLEVVSDEHVPIRLKAYNAPPSMKLDELEPGARYLRLSANAIPGASGESLAPHRATRDPWWAISAQAILLRGDVYPLGRDWDSVYKSRAQALYEKDGDYHGGLVPPVSLDGCADLPCRISRTLEWLNQAAPSTGQHPWPSAEKASEVLDRGQGSVTDRARLLARALQTQDVRFQFAFTAPKLSQPVDLDAPNTEILEQLILWLPAQGGAPGTWIDPDCSYCRFGEVPEDLLGAKALLLEETSDAPGHTAYVTKFQTIGGTLPRPSQRTTTYALTWREVGDLVWSVKRQTSGRAAQGAYQYTREWNAERWKEAAETSGKQLAPNAEILSHAPFRLEPSSATGERSFEVLIRGHAILDGERLIVPLTPFFSAWEEDLMEEERKFDIRVDASEFHEDHLEIPVPEGYQLETLPQPRSAKSPLFELQFSADESGGKVHLRRGLQAHFGLVERSQYSALRRVIDELRATKKDAITFRRVPSAP